MKYLVFVIVFIIGWLISCHFDFEPNSVLYGYILGLACDSILNYDY